MVVEVVEQDAGQRYYRRVVKRLVVVVAVLTVGMIVLWPHEEAHRSVLSFVVTCSWTLAAIALSLMMNTRPDGEDLP